MDDIEDVIGGEIISLMRGDLRVLLNGTMQGFRYAPGRNESSNRKQSGLLFILYFILARVSLSIFASDDSPTCQILIHFDGPCQSIDGLCRPGVDILA
jgi:hypothetical protein